MAPKGPLYRRCHDEWSYFCKLLNPMCHYRVAAQLKRKKSRPVTRSILYISSIFGQNSTTKYLWRFFWISDFQMFTNCNGKVPHEKRELNKCWLLGSFIPKFYFMKWNKDSPDHLARWKLVRLKGPGQFHHTWKTPKINWNF